jgi:hypothetical protein
MDALKNRMGGANPSPAMMDLLNRMRQPVPQQHPRQPQKVQPVVQDSSNVSEGNEDGPPPLEDITSSSSDIPEDFRPETHGATTHTTTTSDEDDEAAGTTARGTLSSFSAVNGVEDSDPESLGDTATLAGEMDDVKWAGSGGGGGKEMLTDSEDEKMELPKNPPLPIDSGDESLRASDSFSSSPSKKSGKRSKSKSRSRSVSPSKQAQSITQPQQPSKESTVKFSKTANKHSTSSSSITPQQQASAPMSSTAFSPPPPYPYLYRLQAVVLHYGSHDSGHFVTYRRVPHPGSVEASQLTLDKPEDLEEFNHPSPSCETEEQMTEDMKMADALGNPIDATATAGNGGLRRRKKGSSSSQQVGGTERGSSMEEGGGADTDMLSSSSEMALPSRTIAGADGQTKSQGGVLTAAALRKKKKRKKLSEDVGSGMGGFVGGLHHRDRWFRISDERVDVVKDIESEVYGHGAQFVYMMFYERVKDGKRLY